MNLQPAEILEKFKNKELDKLTAINYLKLIIENYDDSNLRINATKILLELGDTSNEIFKFLENLLISDSEIALRLIALELLIEHFYHRAYKPLEWIAKYDTSAILLKRLFELLENSRPKLNKNLSNIILNRYSKYFGVNFQEAKFFLELNGFDIILNDSLVFGRSEDLSSEEAWFVVKNDRTILLGLGEIEQNILPESIELLTELRYLYLRKSSLIDLPMSLAKLRNLEVLDLSNPKRMRKVPKVLSILSDTNFSSKYVKKKIVPEEASVLGIIESFIGVKLDNYDERKDFRGLYHYKLNKNGNIIGIYLSDDESFRLSFIPEQITKLKKLEELYLWENDIEIIPKFIGDLNSLKILELAYNKIYEIPESIQNLTLLERLNLSRNKISKIPDSIKNLRNLKDLSLHHNCINIIPKSIGKLKNVKNLNLSNNKIKEIPKNVGKLKNLRDFNVSINQIIKIPGSLGKLKQLRRLILNGCNIIEFPLTLKKLRHLEEFISDFKKLPYISPERLLKNRINNFVKDYRKKGINKKEAEVLGLLNNNIDLRDFQYKVENIEDYRDSGFYKINSHKQVVILHLSIFNTIPDQIQKLKHLEELHITSSSDKEVPIWIGHLSHLKKLHLTYLEGFKIFPNSIERLKKLELLDITGNELKKIPDFIGNIESLEFLNLSYNNLKDIPSSIGRLKNLEILDINNNILKRIPESITQLNKLKKLRLDNLQVKNISNLIEIIDNLSSLKQIDLCYNFQTENYLSIDNSIDVEVELKFSPKIKKLLIEKGIKVVKYFD